MPSNPADAKGLMISAIRDGNPAAYVFHKGVTGLPWMVKNARSITPWTWRSRRPPSTGSSWREVA